MPSCRTELVKEIHTGMQQLKQAGGTLLTPTSTGSLPMRPSVRRVRLPREVHASSGATIRAALDTLRIRQPERQRSTAVRTAAFASVVPETLICRGKGAQEGIEVLG